MHYSSEVDLQTTLKTLCDQRAKDAEIFVQIIQLAKQLKSSTNDLAEAIRFPEYINESKEDDLRKKMDARYWSQVLDLCQIERFTTTADKNKIRDNFQENPPVFDFKTVSNTINTFESSTNAIATTMIKKIFDRIVNLNFRVGNNYKNTPQFKNKYQIEKSFRATIFYNKEIPSYVSDSSSRFDLIDDLERACYLVDSKSQPDRQNCIRSIVDGGLRQNKRHFENAYFSLQLFNNGNIKIDFKDFDVLNRLNSWGSDGTRISF